MMWGLDSEEIFLVDYGVSVRPRIVSWNTCNWRTSCCSYIYNQSAAGTEI